MSGELLQTTTCAPSAGQSTASIMDDASNVRRQTLIALGLSFILTAIYFYDIVFTDKIFADRDTLLVYMPMFKYWAERILSGEWPDWYPYDGLGQPYAGAMVGIAFHPIKLLFLLMNVGAAMKWATLLCFPLAFNGMFHLCRSLKLDWRACFMGALLFAFNGYIVSMTNNFPYLLGMASLPWCWWLTVRVYRQPSFARVALAALSYALMLLTGEVQSFITVCMTGLAFAFLLDGWQGRRGKAFLIYCGVMALACLMCAIQWVPALQVMREAAPGGGTAPEAALNWSLHPFRFVELLLGGANGHSYNSELWFRMEFMREDITTATYWARSIYFGAVGFLCAAFAWYSHRRVFWMLLASIIFTLIVAMGKYAGLYELLKIFPLFRPLRYPEKILSLTMLLLSLMAAFGAAFFFTGKVPSRTMKCAVVSLMSLFGILLLGEMTVQIFSEKLLNIISLSQMPVPKEIQEEVGGFVSISLSLSLGTLLIISMTERLMGPKLLFPAVAICCFLLLLASSRHVFTPTVPEAASEISPAALALRNETGEGNNPRMASMSQKYNNTKLNALGLAQEGRWMSNALGMKPVYGGLFGVESVSYYLPAVSRRAVEIRNIRKDFQLYLFIAALFSATHFTAWRGDFDTLKADNSIIAYENPDLDILLARLGGVMPRAYLSRPFFVPDEKISLGILAGRRIDYSRYSTILRPGESAPVSANTPPPDADLGNASIIFRKPEHVAIDVDAHTDGSLLVLTDAFYTGWTAMIDGSPAEILPANHAVRGVMVPKGKHRVEFKYRTPGLIPAAIVSLGTMLAASIVLCIRRRQRSDSDVLSVQGEKA